MNKKKIIPMLVAMGFVVVVMGIILLSNLIEKYTPSEEMADLEAYFGIEGGEDIGIVLEDNLSEIKGKYIDGQVYIDYQTVQDYLNPRFYWDGNENVLVYTTPKDIITAGAGSQDYFVTKTKNTEGYVIVKADTQGAYIALEFVKKYTDIEYEVFETPNRVQISYVWDVKNYATVKSDSQVRVKGGIKSPILTQIKKDDSVVIIEEGKDWACVRTKDGYIGYTKKKVLNNFHEKVEERTFEEPVYTSISKDFTINMAWHQVMNPEGNAKLATILQNAKGLNVISPTWFSLTDNDGNISSLASTDYVNYAHQNGVEVWALVGNVENEVNTTEILSYTSKREYLINQIISSAIQYNLDGINIDFEQLSVEGGGAFIQFIRELSIKCRNNGIVLSIDNYVPTEYTKFYNRKEQGIVADYVVIMAYDEHYGGGDKSGSVASIGFVKDGVTNTLKEVPANKIIMGMPFYTRIWKETLKSGEADTVEAATEELPYDLSSEAVGMDTTKKTLETHGVTPVWDETSGQYYGEYEKDGSTYKVWMEEETSIEEKLKVMKEHNLAGVSAWKLGFERNAIWDTILKYMN